MNAAILKPYKSPLGAFSAPKNLLETGWKNTFKVGMALAISLSLFSMMDQMTSTGEITLDESEPRWIKLPIEDIKDVPPRREEPEPIEKFEPEKVPELPPTEPTAGSDSGPTIFTTGPSPKGPSLPEGLVFGGRQDGGLLPLVIIQPEYPERARQRGLEGYVIVQLTVGTDGLVIPGSASVIDASHKRIFDKAALKAVAKFKYKPLVVNGVPREVKGVTYQFTFTMEKE